MQRWENGKEMDEKLHGEKGFSSEESPHPSKTENPKQSLTILCLVYTSVNAIVAAVRSRSTSEK